MIEWLAQIGLAAIGVAAIILVVLLGLGLVFGLLGLVGAAAGLPFVLLGQGISRGSGFVYRHLPERTRGRIEALAPIAAIRQGLKWPGLVAMLLIMCLPFVPRFPRIDITTWLPPQPVWASILGTLPLMFLILFLPWLAIDWPLAIWALRLHKRAEAKAEQLRWRS